jgi:hypothetical protein
MAKMQLSRTQRQRVTEELARLQRQDSTRRLARRRGHPVSPSASAHLRALWADEAVQRIVAEGGSPVAIAYHALIVGYERGCTEAASQHETKTRRTMSQAWKANASAAKARRAKYAAHYRSLPSKLPVLQRLAVTAKRFGVHPNTVRNALKR